MSPATRHLRAGDALTLAGPDPISAVEVELAWDRPARRRFSLLEHALDLVSGGPGPPSALVPTTCAVVFDRTGSHVDTVSRSKLYSSDGAVHWASTTDGRVVVELTHAGDTVAQVVFLICAPGGDLSAVARTWVRFHVPGTADPIAVHQFDNPGRPHGARVMAKLGRRDNGRWTISAIGDASVAGTVPDFVAAASLHL